MAVGGISGTFSSPWLAARSTARHAGSEAAAPSEIRLDAPPLTTPFPPARPVDIAARIAEEKLAAIDGEVRAHEAAHLAAAGTAAGGGASFDYVIGPDGERYAVGGSVRVVAQPVYGDPEATIRKAQALIRAAYAVSLPSAADMRVAAEAYQMEMDAKRELTREAEEAGPGANRAPEAAGRNERPAGAAEPAEAFAPGPERRAEQTAFGPPWFGVETLPVRAWVA